MADLHKWTITTKDLVAALTVYGYRNLADEISDEFELLAKPLDLYQAVQWSEKTVKQSGYWSEDRESHLTVELERLLHLLVHTNKKFSCQNKEKIMKIHYINEENIVVEQTGGYQHTFFLYDPKEGYSALLYRFYNLDPTDGKEIKDMPVLEMSGSVYNDLNALDYSSLKEKIQDDQFLPAQQIFLKNFQENSQQFNRYSFLSTDYVNDAFEQGQILFSLPGNGFMWNLNYDQILQDKIKIEPISLSEYFRSVNDGIKNFFEDPVLKIRKPRAEDRKKFSIKRGLRFLYRSNIVLLVLVIFAYIDYGQWTHDGGSGLGALIICYECFTLVFAVMACLKPRFQRHSLF